MEDYDRDNSLLYVRKRAVKIKKETKERLEQYLDQDRKRASGRRHARTQKEDGS